MRARIQNWGKGLALRLPMTLALEVGLEKDSEVELSVEKGRLVVAPLAARWYTLAELLADVQSSNLHAETEWGLPVGKEI
jgi:antitoxin MazE